MESIAQYSYSEGQCGHTAASEFYNEVMKTLKKVAQSPLAYAFEWGHPQRRTFLNYRNQFTIILVISPSHAKTNEDILEVLYTNIYPSLSKEGNLWTTQTT